MKLSSPMVPEDRGSYKFQLRKKDKIYFRGTFMQLDSAKLHCVMFEKTLFGKKLGGSTQINLQGILDGGVVQANLSPPKWYVQQSLLYGESGIPSVGFVQGSISILKQPRYRQAPQPTPF